MDELIGLDPNRPSCKGDMQKIITIMPFLNIPADNNSQGSMRVFRIPILVTKGEEDSRLNF